MSGNLRFTLCLGMSLAWIAYTAAAVRADPSQDCRDLAMQFGTSPAQLEANSLARLGACVMAEIKERSSAPSQSPPDAQQPDPSRGSPIDQPGWGQWSSPAPWSDDRAKSQPWGDP